MITSVNPINAKEVLKSPLLNSIKYEAGMKLMNSNGQVDTSSMGYQYTIQTTTFIHAKTVDQVFYELDGRKISDYIPVEMGVAAWMENIKTNLTYLNNTGDFWTGVQSLASGPTRKINTSIGVTPVNAQAYYWVGGYQYNTFEINKALALNNWNIVEAQAKANKKVFDLGLQQAAFLGHRGDLTNCSGLLSNPAVTINTSLLSGNISALSYSDFNTFVSAVIAAYRTNSNETAFPNRFVIPMADFVGLASFVSPQYPNIQKITALEDAFKRICGPDFQILPLTYANMSVNAGYWATNGTYRYVLYRHDPEVVKMDIPLAYTLNAPGTSDNFTWNVVSYAQFTGAIAYRIPQMLYIDHV